MPERIPPSGPRSTQQAVSIAQVGAQVPGPQKTLKTAALLHAAAQGLDGGGTLAEAALARPPAVGAVGQTPPAALRDETPTAADNISAFYASLVGLTSSFTGGDPDAAVAAFMNAFGKLEAGTQDEFTKQIFDSLINPTSPTSSNPTAVSAGYMLIFHFSWSELMNGSWLSGLPAHMRDFLTPQQTTITNWLTTTFGDEAGYEKQRATMKAASVMSFCFDISQPGSLLGSARLAELGEHFAAKGPDGTPQSIFSRQALFGLIGEAQEGLDPAAIRGTCISQLDVMAQQLGSVLKSILPPAPNPSKVNPDPGNGVLGQYSNGWTGDQWKSFATMLNAIYNATAPLPGPGSAQPAVQNIANQSFTLKGPDGKDYTIPPIAWFFPADAGNSTDTSKLQAALTDIHNAIGNIDVYKSLDNGVRKRDDKGMPPVVKLSTLMNLDPNSNATNDLGDALNFTWNAAVKQSTSAQGGVDTWSPDSLGTRLASALQGLNPMLANFSSSAQSSTSTLLSMSQSAYQQKQSVIASLLTTQAQIMNGIFQAIRSSGG